MARVRYSFDPGLKMFRNFYGGDLDPGVGISFTGIG
jgi:hypothetical protein